MASGADKYLLFSDMPGDHLRRWSAGGRRHHLPQALQQVERPRLGPQGRLLACEHATSRVTRTEPDGRITVLASHYDGKELTAPTTSW